VTRLALFRVLYLSALMALGASFVSAAATPIRQLTNTQASNIRPAWSPDGKQIAFQSNRDGPYHIYVMNADGSNVRQLTSGESDDRHPAWSADGKRLAIDSGDQANREIWTVDVGSRQRTQVTKLGAIASFPSWSPDGKRIAFYLYQAGAMDVWAATLENASTPLRLTRDLANEQNNQCTFACHSVAWAPDSSRLALSDGDSSRVLLMSSLGGAQTAISPSDERSHFPVYLPDGRLVYVTEHISQDQSWTDLWQVDPSGGAPRTEIATQVQVQGPFEFTADASQILFASPRTGNFEIYAVTLDAAGRAALATKPERINPDQVSQVPQSTGRNGLGLPTTAEPYLLAFGVLALGAVAIESLVRRRRRART
jgi:dipeptidyl aminopeptidase/acylaminoacyl peptidase